jgi:hypothetical protein
MVRFDREELAWAAGLFDGEGCTYAKYHDNGRVVATVALVQTDPRPLRRFREVIGFGNFNGPYQPKNPKHSPLYDYRAVSFEHSQAVIAMLWHWLSEPKREQATKVFMDVKAYHARQQAQRDNPTCRRGHPLEGPGANVYHRMHKGTLIRHCNQCKIELREAAATRKNEEAQMLRRILEQPWTQR